MSNKKKNLLNENTIRRFMKLAEIDTLSDGFVTGLIKEQEDEDTSFAGTKDGPDTGASGLELGDETAELDIEEPAGENEAIFSDLANAFADVAERHGVDVAVDGGEEELPGEDELVDVDVEDDLMAEDDVKGLDTDPFDPAVATGMAAATITRGKKKPTGAAGTRRAGVEENYYRQQAVYQENLQRAANYRYAVKNEVLRRVTARLQQESRKDAVADQLSERILRRIKGQSRRRR